MRFKDPAAGAPPLLYPPPDESDLPLRMGRYELLSVIGRGGCARVYGAILYGDHGFLRPVAIKLLEDPDCGFSGRERLYAEARLAGQIHHPNVVSIFDLREADGCPFMVMERVFGFTLSDAMGSRIGVPPGAVLDFALQACAGLSAAHGSGPGNGARGVIHMDLKPANLMINRSGTVKITDFGVALQRGQTPRSPAGWVVGTPGFMAPEAVHGQCVDGRADVWSLASVLFLLSTGRPLLTGPTAVHRATRTLHVEKILARPQTWAALPATLSGLAPVLRAALRKDPSARTPSIEALARDIQVVRRNLGIGPGLRLWVRRHASVLMNVRAADPILPHPAPQMKMG